MTVKKDDGKEFRQKQEDAIQIMADKEPGFEESAAATNEQLLSKAKDLTDDEVKASIDLNSPVGSRAAYNDGKSEKKD